MEASDKTGSHIGIIGAGIAGIYAALQIDELNKQNAVLVKEGKPPVSNYPITYELLETDCRAGGRVKTHTYDDTK